ncbi:uncharacterized protein PFL1_06639 [Pseudozyma flocculosa PF-1]|uniref:RRM domain-containing protein n=2 Tax=Pseudozyma flocculosa TaxID=84751 RepID=A0A5C3FAQ5_9BASI|nr:uncharacterized protein PFL1_06639 [Pseudozyma flocculosa PF-1]EPQ25772.1 hypothetical protein PFL1_06639 [Pseudozyma flocculosa PF-1]SPO40531.1 uncharacterized protein PSFLO_06013 [Pseudozyma flocculosa]
MTSPAGNAARSQAASPAPSHSTAATFGNAGGSNAPPSQSGPGLQPPHYPGMPIQRTASQNTAYSGRSRNSGPGARPNGASGSSEPPYIIDGPSGRIACVADVRGNISMFNQIADETNAQAIIHTGDFGFYERSSFERISDRTLRHLVQYSTLVSPALRNKLLGSDPPRGPASAEKANASTGLRQQVLNHAEPLLSEFPHLLNGTIKLKVPVFTVWGACEDVAILERFRTGEYQVPNLHVLDEATTRAIEVGGVRLRLFGLGGAVVLHKLFDNGEGAATIAGGQGTMWTTALQIGELVDTAQKTFDPTETRVLITHASPGREGLLAQLALALKADLTVSAGLHFRYGVSYNEFSVQHDAENFRNKLHHAKQAFGEIWDTVKTQVDAVIDSNQRVLLDNALAVANRVPPTATATGAASEEPAWKNTWNWNLPDAAYGNLVLSIRDGRVSAETKSQGFNFAYRRNNQSMSAATPTAPTAANSNGPAAVSGKNASSAASPKAPGPAQGSAAANGGGASTPGTPSAAKNGGGGATTPSTASAKGGAKDKKTPREKGHESAASRSDAEGYLTSGTEGGSGRKGGAPRNPNTIYISQFKDALPISEADIREYFGPAAAGITSIKLIFDKERFSHRRGVSSGKEDAAAPAGDNVRRQRPFAYVEFKDEEAMKAAFKRQGQTIKGTDIKPALEQADSAKIVGGTATPAKSERGDKPEKADKKERKQSKSGNNKEAAAAVAAAAAAEGKPSDGKQEGGDSAGAAKSDTEGSGAAKEAQSPAPGGKPKKARGGKGHNKKGSGKVDKEGNGNGSGNGAAAGQGEANGKPSTDSGEAKAKASTPAAAPAAAAAAPAPASAPAPAAAE